MGCRERPASFKPYIKNQVERSTLMEKAVQVGLVFPRSGQRVQVTLPSAHVERLGVRYNEDHPNTVTLIYPNRAQQARETSKHA
jgi:hypothetical protein